MEENDDIRFSRTRLLLGEERFARLNAAHVLVLGVGGVGAFAAEELARAGVGELTLIDGDRVELSNCNRQLPALDSTQGREKVQVMAERLRDINPAIKVHARFEFLEGEGIGRLLETRFDYAIDAIDSLTPKVDFILACRVRKIPLISSMGAGGKMDLSQIRIADIGKTYGCKLARAVRSKLKERRVTRGVKVVFSPEEVPSDAVLRGERRSTVGTISYLPAVFGCFCASVVIRDLTGRNS